MCYHSYQSFCTWAVLYFCLYVSDLPRGWCWQWWRVICKPHLSHLSYCHSCTAWWCHTISGDSESSRLFNSLEQTLHCMWQKHSRGLFLIILSIQRWEGRRGGGAGYDGLNSCLKDSLWWVTHGWAKQIFFGSCLNEDFLASYISVKFWSLVCGLVTLVHMSHQTDLCSCHC